MPTITDLAAEGPRLRIQALKQAINSHGYVAETTDTEPLLIVPSAFGPPVEIRCDARPARDGQLWFYVHPIGRPIAPADDDHLPKAVEAVKARLAAKEQAWEQAGGR
ncbi:hypothetical protein [Actinomadura decatromicini]|uniref:Uncharacterized protein n=1 Tax=Actinomadura decatromicini TaxID=2604572 RepID=A0A5D3FQU5_9ACTN|nr:hypothetical protein [Actinomadura decatromicini]TYK50711.1 hypothetical protein FXF68_09470 [Actinomadura decatromicini]